MIKVLIIILFVIQTNYSATIQGYVWGEDNPQPIIGATIELDSTRETTTDINGYFIFKNVSTGIHNYRVVSIFYKYYYGKVFIKDTSETITLTINLKLGIIKIDTVSRIEKYHRYFKKYTPNNILKIWMDSINTVSYPFEIYSTFKNETDSIIYVIKDFRSLDMINPIIRDSKGKLLRWNVIGNDDMGAKIMLDSSDIIKIFPHAKINYPPIKLYSNDFSHYPSGTYSIKIKYSNKGRRKLPGFYSDVSKYRKLFRKKMYYYNIALRGNYISKDSLVFYNKK